MEINNFSRHSNASRSPFPLPSGRGKCDGRREKKKRKSPCPDHSSVLVQRAGSAHLGGRRLRKRSKSQLSHFLQLFLCGLPPLPYLSKAAKIKSKLFTVVNDGFDAAPRVLNVVEIAPQVAGLSNGPVVWLHPCGQLVKGPAARVHDGPAGSIQQVAKLWVTCVKWVSQPTGSTSTLQTGV